MKHILSILDGLEKGIEISLEPNTIYSIGTQDDSDFYVRRADVDFLVYFQILGDSIEWWANKSIQATRNGVAFMLAAKKVTVAADEVIVVGARHFGVFASQAAAAQVLESMPDESPTEQEPEPALAEQESEPEQDYDASQFPFEQPVSSIPTPVVALDESLQDPLAAPTQPAPSGVAPESSKTAPSTSKRTEPTLAGIIDPKVIQAARQGLPDAQKAAVVQPPPPQKSTLMQFLKIVPFIIGAVILIAYGVINRPTSNSAPNPVNMSPEAKKAKENQGAAFNTNATVGEIDSMLAEEGVETIPDNSTDEDAQFIASGSEYNTNAQQWKRIKPAANEEKALDTLRKKVDDGTVKPIEAAEVLFPDEKMMGLIKDMLDTAGAEGIDVRFDRGSYDVFGYVLDDAKWQRTLKILTFDLDLTKVQFSVETSVSLVKKYETLLKKFNLSDYVVLSLGQNGQIFAKTYYPPALQGLWYTIKSRFEKKYGQYTNIKEYRAHIGWINVVKVSFDQPSYVLLADGRRLVEGSIWGGSSVLDKIYDDAIRVTAGPAQTRYYVINKSRAMIDNSLSDR